MNPSENSLGGSPPNGVLKNSEFLTAEEIERQDLGGVPPMPQTGEAPQVPPQQPPINPSSDIPDLEKEKGLPNNTTKATLNKIVDETITIEDKIEDKIAKDIENVQKKHNAIPQDPKDILKNLIKKGEHTEEINLFGATWKLRALDQGDLLLVTDEIRDETTTYTGRLTALEFSKVVFSIEAINTIPIYEFFPEITLQQFNNNKMNYIIAVKRALRRYMEALPPVVTDSLYLEYIRVEEVRDEAMLKLKNS